MSLLNAVIWYWTKLRWWPKASSKEECNDVTWIELVIDFQNATHMPLTPDGNDDDNDKLLAKALRFKKITDKMCRMLRTTVSPLAPTKGSRAGVTGYMAKALGHSGMVTGVGLPGRPRFLSHHANEQMNETASSTREGGIRH